VPGRPASSNRAAGSGPFDRRLLRRAAARAAVWAVPLPFLLNTAGWLLTENGRQPWIVQGLQLTKAARSPSVSLTTIAISFGVFVALYGVLAIVDLILMTRFARREIGPETAEESSTEVPEMSY
jgi:cytochrome d ubiquinol oxidase subunit I